MSLFFAFGHFFLIQIFKSFAIDRYISSIDRYISSICNRGIFDPSDLILLVGPNCFGYIHYRRSAKLLRRLDIQYQIIERLPEGGSFTSTCGGDDDTPCVWFPLKNVCGWDLGVMVL